MSKDGFGISQESVGEALEYAAQCVPLVLDNLNGTIRADKIGETQKANIETMFITLRLINDPTMLVSIRLFVEAKVRKSLDSSSKNMFAFMIGGLEEGDLIPSDYSTFYGADGFGQAYRKARISHSAKVQKQIAKIAKPWSETDTDKFWDSVLLLTRQNFGVINMDDVKVAELVES